MSLQELMNVKVTTYPKAKQSEAETWSLILLKIISMDRNLQRFGNPIKIGVNSDKIFHQLKRCEKKYKINGITFKTGKFNSIETASQFNIIHITNKWKRNRFSAIETLAENGCFIFCEDETSILCGYAAVLFKVGNKYPHVAINLDNSADQGADFPEDLLDAIVIVRN
ncbi:MAG: hypothetical protein GY950_25950 [bacterium]|nr:hypothetical protein [bacterium]